MKKRNNPSQGSAILIFLILTISLLVKGALAAAFLMAVLGIVVIGSGMFLD